jgi:glycosyltransferase involved in cell wall biosynthesis
MTISTIATVIPLYNKEPYIARAIASVLAQTRPVDEIIIVDDASTDGSLERIKAFQDSRIRVLRRTDPRQRGLPATRNLGIRSATSRWIALLDADDRWHEDFIEESNKLMAQASDRIGFLFTGWASVSPNGIVTRDAYSVRCEGAGFRRLDLDSFVSAWLDLDACPVFPSSVVIRRDMLLDAGLFEERCRRGEDKDMWLRVLSITDALSSPRVCSSYYRDIPGAMNETISTNMRHCLCATLEKMIPLASGPRRHLLMRLFNHQVTEYARWVAGRERLSPDVYRGFFVSIDPRGYLLLLALSYLPVWFLKTMRKGMLSARDVIGRRDQAGNSSYSGPAS